MRGIELEFLSDDETIPRIEVRMVLWNRSTLPFQMKRFGSARPSREGEAWRVRFPSEGGWYLQEMDGMDLLFLPAEKSESFVPRIEVLGFRFF
jgi:hypothetical protein